MAFTDFMNPVFNPLLSLHPFLAIFIMALLITFMITIIYKYTTDQVKMKKLKTELKEYQDKIRALSKEGKSEKALALQNEALSRNMEYMKHSFRSTLWTMVPVLLIFAWMSANLAYHPIAPGQEFTVVGYFAEGHASNASLSTIPDIEFVSDHTQAIARSEELDADVAVWKLKAPVAGEYKVTINYNGEVYDHIILISPDKKYSSPEKLIKDSKLKKIVIGNDKVYTFEVFGIKFTWFWSYVLLSVFLSIAIRKIMQVY